MARIAWAAGLLLCLTAPAAAQWPAFHGNPARTGHLDAPPIDKPSVRWKARVGITGWLNAPLVDQGVVFVPSSGTRHNKADEADGVYALDLKSGGRLWHRKLGGDANGIALHGKLVYAGSDDGHLYALERRTGKVRWKRPGQGKVYSHPLVVHHKVIVGDASGHLRAFGAKDGKPAWEIPMDGPIRGGTASDGETIYAVSQEGMVLAVSPGGDRRWRAVVKRPPWGDRGGPVRIEAYSPPIVAGDLLVLPFARDTYYRGKPALVALDRRTGKVVWRARGPKSWGNIRSTPALAGSTLVYGEPYSGDVVGIDVKEGVATWRRTVGPCLFPQWSSPASVRGLVYVARMDGAVYALAPKDGKLKWTLYLGDSSRVGEELPEALGRQRRCDWKVSTGSSIYAPLAVAKDGTLLVGTAEGFLFAVR